MVASTTKWLALAAAMLLWSADMAAAARQEGDPSANATTEAIRYKKAGAPHHYRNSKPGYYSRQDNHFPMFHDKGWNDYAYGAEGDAPADPAPHYGTYDNPHERYGSYHEEHPYSPRSGYPHKKKCPTCPKPTECQPRLCTCECDLQKVGLTNSNGCNATRPCTAGELGAVCVDTVPGAPNTCSSSLQPASWAYCRGSNLGIDIDGVASGSAWAAVPVSGVDLTFGRNASAGNAPIPTNGDNFAFRVTSDNNGLYFLAQTFNANNLTYTAINWGLAGNNAAWRYRLADSNACAAPKPTNPPVCFQKGNDSAVGSPSGLTTLSLADASIQLAATYDSTTNTSTQEVFVPWSTILDGQNGWDPTASALNLTFAGSWLRDCPDILAPVNSCNGRWGKPGVGGTQSDFFTNQTYWVTAPLSVDTPNDFFPALCHRVECPREGRISIQGSSVPVGSALSGCDVTDGLYLYAGAFNTTALFSNATSINYEGPCTAGQEFNLCEINGIILTSSLRFKFSGQYSGSCPAQCATLGCAGGPV